MSKADEMFEKLGYLKESDYYYRSKEDAVKHKQIRFMKQAKEFIVESKLRFSYEITMQELQAINEKCKELRMDLEEIKKQFEKGNVDLTIIFNGLIEEFEKDKTSLDIQQLQLLCEFLIEERNTKYE